MKLGCIILAHRAPDQVALLTSALCHPQARIYLHLDRRCETGPFYQALAIAGTRDVVPLRQRDGRWGGGGIVDASLDGLARGLADGCDYFVLISGQDFPLRPMDEILGFIEANRRSYIESFALPTARWRFDGRDRTDFYTYDVLGRRETCVPRGEDISFLNRKGRLLNELLRVRSAFKPRRRFPRYARAFGGSQWWNLSRPAAQYVFDFIAAHPDYRRYHEHTLLPDELFFQSILVGTRFAEEHEVMNDSLRYLAWDGSHPRTLTSDDLPAMVGSDKLFARKFDVDTDRAVLTELAESEPG